MNGLFATLSRSRRQSSNTSMVLLQTVTDTIMEDGLYYAIVTGKRVKTSIISTSVSCSKKTCGQCQYTMTVNIIEKVCHSEYLTVLVSSGETKIENALVHLYDQEANKTLASNLTNRHGALKILMNHPSIASLFLVSAAGYENKTLETTVSCPFQSCGSCSPVVEINLVVKPPPRCPQKVLLFMSVISNRINKGIKDASITVTYDNETIAETVKSDSNGTVMPILLEKDGTYSVLVEAFAHQGMEFSFDVARESRCENVSRTMNMTFVPPEIQCPNMHLNLTISDISIQDLRLNLGQAVVDVYYRRLGLFDYPPDKIVTGLKTNSLGYVKIPATSNGNYTLMIRKEGYLPMPVMQTVIVNCNTSDCSSCQPVIHDVDLYQPTCSQDEYPTNVHLNVSDFFTHLPIPGAEFNLKLVKYQNISLDKSVGKIYADENGMASFYTSVNGIYSIKVEQSGYVAHSEQFDKECNPEECQSCNITRNVYLKEEFCKNTVMQLRIIDAENNNPIVGAKVIMRRIGIDNQVLLTVGEVESNGTGHASIPIRQNGNYTFFAEKANYTILSENITVNVEMSDCSTYAPMSILPLSTRLPCSGAAGVRLSLVWDDRPQDLDLYTFRVGVEVHH